MSYGDWKEYWFGHFVLQMPVFLSGVGAKIVSWTWLSHSKDGAVWLWNFLVNLHLYDSQFAPHTAQWQWPMTVGRDSILCHSYGLVCHQRVLKTFHSPGYLRSEDGVVWVWHFSVNLHICGSPFNPAASQSQCLMAIERDGAWAHYVIFAGLLVMKEC